MMVGISLLISLDLYCFQTFLILFVYWYNKEMDIVWLWYVHIIRLKIFYFFNLKLYFCAHVYLAR